MTRKACYCFKGKPTISEYFLDNRVLRMRLAAITKTLAEFVEEFEGVPSKKRISGRKPLMCLVEWRESLAAELVRKLRKAGL